MKPRGYNVSKVIVNELSHEELARVVEVLLQRLKVTVWMDSTPDYDEIILTDTEECHDHPSGAV